MKKRVIGVIFAICLIAFSAGCAANKTKETKDRPESDSETTESVEPSSKTTETDGSETEKTTISETSESSSEVSEKKENASLEDTFLAACEKAGVEMKEGTYGDNPCFECKEDRKHAFAVKYNTAKEAEDSYKEILDYGGWYEEDLVTKDIRSDGEDYLLTAYYCQDEYGETYLFVNACKDEMRFSLEGWNSQETAEIETICQEMGFSLA